MKEKNRVAVIQVTIYRPLPGRYPGFLGRVVEGKKIIEGLGARFRVIGTQFGARPQSVAVVVEYVDMAQFAEIATKLESDQGWQALQAKVQDDPTAELLEQSLGGDIPLPE